MFLFVCSGLFFLHLSQLKNRVLNFIFPKLCRILTFIFKFKLFIFANSLLAFFLFVLSQWSNSACRHSLSAEKLNYSGLGLPKKKHRLNNFLVNLCFTCLFGCIFYVYFNVILFCFFITKYFNLKQKINQEINLNSKRISHKKQNQNKMMLKMKAISNVAQIS